MAASGPTGRLEAALAGIGPLALAVSGGVDSMTLAHVAHRRPGGDATMFHALSPAVPAEATARVRRHAEAWGWDLRVVNAGEMEDPRYLENPANRCFFCKSNLYARIAGLTRRTIASGANTDDLGDYRPGLAAARERRVRHPYIEAGIGKAEVRAIARGLGLDDLAELPAAPCLSSRLETGIAVTAERLALVEAAEALLRAELGPGTLRCRLRKAGIAIELEPALLERAGAGTRARIEALLAARGHSGPVVVEPYRMGSAFLRAGRERA